MTLQSYTNNSEEVVADGANSSINSASTLSTDVYPLPFSAGQKEIVLTNDERALVGEVNTENFITPNTNICVTESSNIDIGNRTVFNRDVTIYQYIQGNNLPEIQNGAVGQDEVECNKTVQVITPEEIYENNYITKRSERAAKRRNQYIVFALLVALCLIAASIVGILITTKHDFILNYHSSPVPPNISTSSIETPISGSDLDLFILKKAWGGIPAINITKIAPATLVVIKHTGGSLCTDTKTCQARVKEMQKKDMEVYQMPDIRYNFLVGADGKIYIGRGWRVQNEGRNDSLDIAFIGNFSENSPSRTMLNLGKIIILIAPWSDDALAVNYCIVNHNQTEITDNPGEKLFEEVTYWKHYSDDIYLDSTGFINEDIT